MSFEGFCTIRTIKIWDDKSQVLFNFETQGYSNAGICAQADGISLIVGLLKAYNENIKISCELCLEDIGPGQCGQGFDLFIKKIDFPEKTPPPCPPCPSCPPCYYDDPPPHSNSTTF